MDDKSGKLNHERLNSQPDSAGTGGISLEAELEAELGRSVAAEMDGTDAKDLISIYENSNTVKGMVAAKKEELTAEHEEQRRKKKVMAFKLGTVVCLLGVIMIFASIAWFTMNREVGTGGMSMNSEGVPYTIETRNESGYYKDAFDSLGLEAMEWKISSTHNFDNHSGAIKVDETEPALEPGDRGSLEFRISPQNNDSITVDCLFDVKAFLEEETTDEHNNTVTTITEINNDIITGFLEAHVMLFAGYDPVTGKYTDLIDNNNLNLERLLASQQYNKNETVYTVIYWCWPEHLSDLTDSTQTIYDPDEHEKVIAYMARNKDKFFKDCNDSVEKVQADLTSLYTTYSNSLYNYYNMKYDNADLVIGNNVSYIVLSMQVK